MKTTTPILTDEQRMQALQAAREARSKRAEILKEFQDGQITFEDVLSMQEDNVIGRMKFQTLIERIPGIGKRKAEKILEELKISPNARLRGLGCRQLERIKAWYKTRGVRADE